MLLTKKALAGLLVVLLSVAGCWRSRDETPGHEQGSSNRHEYLFTVRTPWPCPIGLFLYPGVDAKNPGIAVGNEVELRLTDGTRLRTKVVELSGPPESDKLGVLVSVPDAKRIKEGTEVWAVRE